MACGRWPRTSRRRGARGRAPCGAALERGAPPRPRAVVLAAAARARVLARGGAGGSARRLRRRVLARAHASTRISIAPAPAATSTTCAAATALPGAPASALLAAPRGARGNRAARVRGCEPGDRVQLGDGARRDRATPSRRAGAARPDPQRRRLRALRPAPATSARACAPELAAGSDVVFLLAGSGFARKGLDTALRALARSAPRRPALGGRRRRHPAVAAPRARARRRPSACAFSASARTSRRCYAAADALLLPTRYDAFANVCLEAAAAGLPVVTSAAQWRRGAVPGRRADRRRPGRCAGLRRGARDARRARACARGSARPRAGRGGAQLGRARDGAARALRPGARLSPRLRWLAGDPALRDALAPLLLDPAPAGDALALAARAAGSSTPRARAARERRARLPQALRARSEPSPPARGLEARARPRGRAPRVARARRRCTRAGSRCPSRSRWPSCADGGLVIATRFLEGRTLKQTLAEQPGARRGAAHAVGDLVARLHAAGWAHGDLHHGNLLVGDGRVWLLDLQAARALHTRLARWRDLGRARPLARRSALARRPPAPARARARPRAPVLRERARGACAPSGAPRRGGRAPTRAAVRGAPGAPDAATRACVWARRAGLRWQPIAEASSVARARRARAGARERRPPRCSSAGRARA